VVPFFVEYDTGGEPLSVLTGKLVGYREWFAALGRVWPVLFWLHSAARERNLRRMRAETPPLVPVATGARDHAATAGLCPAEAVWTAAGDGGQRSTLADLSAWVLDDRDSTGEAA
jgi:hypothetical protein